jgi:hypothetical protein
MDDKTRKIWDEISKMLRPKRSLLTDLESEEEIIWILQKHWQEAGINPDRINDNEKGCF